MHKKRKYDFSNPNKACNNDNEFFCGGMERCRNELYDNENPKPKCKKCIKDYDEAMQRMRDTLREQKAQRTEEYIEERITDKGW